MQNVGRAVLVLVLALGAVAEEEVNETNEDSMHTGLQVNEEQWKKLYEAIDHDRDGKVAATEFHAFAQYIQHHQAFNAKTPQEETFFNHLDTDQDGKVSLQEALPEGSDADGTDYAQHVRAKFRAADKDGDRVLGRDEFPAFEHPYVDDKVEHAFAKSIFLSKDKNSDGFLSSAEFFEHEEGNHGVHDEEFKKLDKDGDGKLEFMEVMAWESGRHDVEQAMDWVAENADLDKDGFVTQDEFVKARFMMEHQNAGYHFEDWVAHMEL